MQLRSRKYSAVSSDSRTGSADGDSTHAARRDRTPIALQLSQTPPQDHPRLHLDLHVASAAEEEAEAVSLVSLGARRVDWDSYPEDAGFIALEDPDGNRFWIVDLSHDHT